MERNKKKMSDQFIGGAERARRQARKQMNQPAPRPNKHHKHQRDGAKNLPSYPKSMRPYDRFFGSLLSSSIDSLRQSQADDRKHVEYMAQCCSLLNVPSLPPMPIKTLFHKSMERKGDARSHHLLQRTSTFLSETTFGSMNSSSGTFDDARSYYMSKAPLILEESRYIVADALNKQSFQKNSGCVLSLQLLSMQEKYPKISQQQCAPLVLTFSVESIKDSEKSMSWSRPGNVFILGPCLPNRNMDLESSVLACIAPMMQSKEDGASRNMSISLMIFRRDNFVDGASKSEDMGIFRAFALTTLISQARQMEACLRMTKVQFMPKLLGGIKSTHIRFIDSDEDGVVEKEEIYHKRVEDEQSQSTEVELDDDIEKDSESDNEDDTILQNLMEKLPQLNLTQEKAATTFLTSLPSSLILVQGPPGTGKSTFLVNVICRRLVTDTNARILVTAPTNKAVIVLAQRFLDLVDEMNDSTFDYTNPVLVGVEDKLVGDEWQSSSQISLRSIFAFTWMESVIRELATLLENLENINKAIGPSLALIDSAKKIQCKLSSGIPCNSSECMYDMRQLVHNLEAAAAAKIWEISMTGCVDHLNTETSSHYVVESIKHGKILLALLKDIDPAEAVTELLSKARVIFCTLTTSGSSLLKQTSKVSDLLVDEAAACSEAEICIPFCLRPERMLAVGDPMQLPPTIMSRHAADLGLSKSMHDRLMNECDEEYFMLDQQYRMVPAISSFPSRQFYNGKITDGNNVTSLTYSSQTFLPMKRPYSFIHVTGNEYRSKCGSYANKEECATIVRIIEEIKKNSKAAADWDSHDKLRIITFYQAQTSLLKNFLVKQKFHNVLVATVDSSQGCEADTVIVSFTRSNDNKGILQAAGFLSDDRRINVAITRGRHQLICVGNANTLGLEGSETLKQLVLDAKERSLVNS